MPKEAQKSELPPKADEGSNPGKAGLAEAVQYLKGLHAAVLNAYGPKRSVGHSQRKPCRSASSA